MSRLDTSGLFYMDLFGREEGLESLLLVINPYSYGGLIAGMDRLVVAVFNKPPQREVEHWMWGETRIQVNRITLDGMEKWITSGEHKGVVQWILEGDVLLDRNGYLEDLRRRLTVWPAELKERKILREFTKFTRTYLQAKEDLKNGQLLDAYSNILSALHHWADISLIEEGMHPELTVWVQMRRVNPGIYKLYEELTTSSETLEQRIQLVLLACEFSVLTKMRTSCALLLRIISSRPEPWSMPELQNHPELDGLQVDLSLVLQKLVMKGYLRETVKSQRETGLGVMEVRYAPAYGD
ncbi:nucleotidyltransferase-like protein [Cohnella thailandensis]|uniref:Nucleotidyltransferase-like domain-containing protein n=1 Tax=Cohnella thailandensis TaxID=557557 RepID=A0A841T237_9BACL|nr:nucleotidyltransferase-like protein [Cohnella thailandensis]MBB6638453.1 hypothetical protein [Cohnella thailandensis]MBP1977487.1 hypothetical protein [Cohnella thailandensis]